MKVSIIGGSGFTGGELTRLLLQHPEAEVKYITSRRYAGKPISLVHPNLEKYKGIKFVLPNIDSITQGIDVIFLATPHGESQKLIPALLGKEVKIIDLSADFRLKSLERYEYFYKPHSCPDLFEKAVYGMPEVNKDKIKDAEIVAVPGCHASCAIYGLLPLARNKLIQPYPIIVDSKTGSTGAGASPTEASHHPIRAGVVRPYKLVGHRHTAEIEETLIDLFQEDYRKRMKVSFSAHAIDIVRGISSCIHAFLRNEDEDEKNLYKAFREFARENPFIRFIKKNVGVFKLPDPKTIVGTNYCDIGFERDPLSNRVVVVSTLDNLIKGASGNAVQDLNIIYGLPEETGLDSLAIFPA